MDKFSTIANAQLVLCTYVIIGWVLAKLKILSDRAKSDLLRLAQSVMLPCLIIYSLAKELTKQQIFEARWIIYISFGIQFFSYLLGTVCFRNELNSKQKAVFRFGTLSSNCGNAGLAILENIMGETGVLYTNLYAIPSRIASWSVGVSFFIDLPIRQKIKKIFLTPSIVAIFIGIIFQFWAPPFPPGLWEAIRSVGKCTNPVSLIAVGYVLADVPIRKLTNRKIFKLSFLRLVVIPTVVLLVLKNIHVSRQMLTAAVILSGNPSAIITAVVAEQFDGDCQLASQCVFITSVLAVFTTTVLYMLV